jgi:hypothetical protein
MLVSLLCRSQIAPMQNIRERRYWILMCLLMHRWIVRQTNGKFVCPFVCYTRYPYVLATDSSSHVRTSYECEAANLRRFIGTFFLSSCLCLSLSDDSHLGHYYHLTLLLTSSYLFDHRWLTSQQLDDIDSQSCQTLSSPIASPSSVCGSTPPRDSTPTRSLSYRLESNRTQTNHSTNHIVCN